MLNANQPIQPEEAKDTPSYSITISQSHWVRKQPIEHLPEGSSTLSLNTEHSQTSFEKQSSNSSNIIISALNENKSNEMSNRKPIQYYLGFVAAYEENLARRTVTEATPLPIPLIQYETKNSLAWLSTLTPSTLKQCTICTSDKDEATIAISDLLKDLKPLPKNQRNHDYQFYIIEIDPLLANKIRVKSMPNSFEHKSRHAIDYGKLSECCPDIIKHYKVSPLPNSNPLVGIAINTALYPSSTETMDRVNLHSRYRNKLQVKRITGENSNEVGRSRSPSLSQKIKIFGTHSSASDATNKAKPDITNKVEPDDTNAEQNNISRSFSPSGCCRIG